MKILFNWNDYLIPMVWRGQNGDMLFDLFINSILFINDDKATHFISRVVFDLTRETESLWRWELPRTALTSHLSVDVSLSQLSIEKRAAVVGMALADNINDLKANPTLQPGEQAILRRFPVRFTTSLIPDKMIVRVYSGSHLIGRNDIPLQPAADTGPYSFPLKGVWQAINNFDNAFMHRQFVGREFAIDFIQLSADGAVRHEKTDSAEDFVCFGQPVYAMESGEVVATHDGEADCDAPKITPALYQKTIGGNLAAEIGNYIQINHDSGISSLYGHLQKQSVRVKKGERIDQASHIANVGNSGLSSIAHLHVQLNHGNSALLDRSIPITFYNLNDIRNQKIELITQNNTIVHT